METDFGFSGHNPQLAPVNPVTEAFLARIHVSEPERGFGGRSSGLMNSSLRTLGLLLLLTMAFGTCLGSTAQATSTRKQEARSQFDKAEQMREALNGRPQSERTRKDYQRVIDAYRKVYYVAPASSKADASVVAVAELLAEMGRQFEPGDKDLSAAIGQYEFLRREYPGSKYRVEALFTIGQIYKEDLGDDDAARNTFEEFLKHYPRSSLARDAKLALAEINAPKPKTRTSEEAAADAPERSAAVAVSLPTVQRKSALPMVTGIRHWSAPDYTRVAIDVDGEVKYEAGRSARPRSHLLRSAQYQTGIGADRQELRSAGRLSEEDSRRPVSARIYPRGAGSR